MALGPDSLLWRWAGDLRIGMLGGSVGLLQLMHPAIGGAVIDHSDFFHDPFDRIFRSLPPILGVVYDGPPAQQTGHAVRDFHRDIKGVDERGRRYHALDPSTFWWAHATFQYMAEQVADRFDDHQLSSTERQQLYAEGVEWYRRYGVSDRCVPADRAAFQRVWDETCDRVLERTEAVEFALEVMSRAKRLPLPGPLAPVDPLLRIPLVRRVAFVPVRIVTIGGLPARLRERLDIPWSRADQLELDAIELTVRKAWPLVPDRLRWHPRARAGWRRVRGSRRRSAA
jgi:uncharacterized protein (DUF2236 family)